MEEVRRELDRLRRAWAAAWGRALLGRLYLGALGVLALLALASRLLGPWPPFAALEGRVVLVLAVAAGLWFVWPLLRRLAPYVGRPAPEVLARRLDDRHDWSDAADAALGLAGRERDLWPVEAFLAAQTTGRLRQLDERALGPRRVMRERSRRLGRALLLAVFVFALLAPGVDGWLGRGGAGRGDSDALAGADADEGALDANRWLEEHARLYLAVPDPAEAPLVMRVRLRTDRPLPADYLTTLELIWDEDLVVSLDDVDVAAGEEAKREIALDLRSVEALADALTPGPHVVRTRLVPRQGPFTAPLVSNEVEIQIQDGDGGGEDRGRRRSLSPNPNPRACPRKSPTSPSPCPRAKRRRNPRCRRAPSRSRWSIPSCATTTRWRRRTPSWPSPTRRQASRARHPCLSPRRSATSIAFWSRPCGASASDPPIGPFCCATSKPCGATSLRKTNDECRDDPRRAVHGG